jgi:arylsulfatase A-like enzyme
MRGTTDRFGSRWGLAVRTIASLAAAVVVVAVLVPGTERAEAQTTPTNVVVVLADDMRWDEAGVTTALNETFPAGYLPTVRSELVAKGFTASNAFVSTSLCCPSRSQILTGNYAHTTGVWNNVSTPSTGGFAAFREVEDSTLATWFDQAGYRTALVGKYMNGYTEKFASHIPPGWDRWVAFAANTIGYYNYKLTIDGTLRSFGTGAANYSTDVLGDYATDFISSTPSERPLFLMYAPYAPHSPFTPAPRHDGMYAGYQPAMPPNVNEDDVSDKPAWVRKLSKGGDWSDNKRKQMEMMMAIDDAIAGMLQALSQSGRLDNTVFVFMSDNGLSGTSHRWTTKKSAWDEAIRVPFVVRGPGIPAGSGGAQMIANIDVAETLGELTGVTVPATDGTSVASILRGGTAAVRDEIALERLEDSTDPPSYCGIRTPIYKYVRYKTGEEELYDLRTDPWEMQSKHAASAYAEVKADLYARTYALCSQPPPGYSFPPPDDGGGGGGLFSDGFESGNLAAWTKSAGLSVQTNVVHGGAYAATNTTSAAWAMKDLGSGQADLYSRMWLNVTNRTDTFQVMRLRTGSNQNLVILIVLKTGKLQIRNAVTGTNTTLGASVHSGWNDLQLHVNVAGSSSQLELWLDGTRVANLVPVSLGTTAIRRVEIGHRATGKTYKAYYDDVGVDTAFVS